MIPVRRERCLRFFIFCLVFILCNVENIVENNVKKFIYIVHIYIIDKY